MLKVYMLLLFGLVIVETFTSLDVFFIDRFFSWEAWVYWRERNNMIMREDIRSKRFESYWNIVDLLLNWIILFFYF